jgi:hypothetical protein
MVDQFTASGQSGSVLNLTGTGDLGAQILANVPAPFRPQVEPIVPQIVQAIHEAFAIAIASTFWISIAAAAVAAVFVLFLRESEIRGTAVARGAEAEV